MHALPALCLLLIPACVSLDAFVHNAVHCSAVSAETCSVNDPWTQLCTPCEEPYDWAHAYDWPAGVGEVRPIPGEAITPLSIPTDDGLGTLDAYYVAPWAGSPRANVTLLYNHGNFASLDHYDARIRLFYEGGYGILAWDYRGYGKSEPATLPSPDQWIADALLLRDLVDDHAPDPDKVVLYGYSLGAIPAVDQARARPGCALVLEAPFTSIHALIASDAGLSLPGSFVTEGQYENINEIADYDGPLLVFAGEQDTRFPPSAVQALVDAAATPADDTQFEIIAGAKHGVGEGIMEQDLEAFFGLLDSFLAAQGCL